jgi:hypothetical protein
MSFIKGFTCTNKLPCWRNLSDEIDDNQVKNNVCKDEISKCTLWANATKFLFILVINLHS